VILRPLKKCEYGKEAAQIFVSGTRDVLGDTARSEDQKCAAKLTLADSDFLSGSSIMFWRRLSIFLLCLLTFAIPFEHKYDKLFRFFSLKLIPENLVLPSFFDKKIYFYPSDIVALCLLLIALFALRIPAKRFFLARGALFLWAVFLFAALSIALSPLAGYPIPYIRLLQLATPFLLFSFLANADVGDYAKTILGCVIAAALIQSGLAIAQYSIQGPLGLRLFSEPPGFPLFGATTRGIWIFDNHSAVLSRELIRPSGTFPHPNVLGGFLSMSILATYSLFSTPKWRLGAALIIPLQFFALSLTFSRSALFSLIGGSLVYLALQWKEHGFLWKPFRLPFFTMIFSLLFSFLVLQSQIRERGGIVNYNELAQGSDALRISYQNLALQIIKDYPLFGAGFHQLSIRGLDYLPKGHDVPASSATHNIYLYLAAETGLLSLTAFLLFIASLLWAAARSFLTPLTASLTAIFLAFLFIGCCDFYPLLFQQGKLPFFLAAGLLAATAKPLKRWLKAAA
jgi:O-antigen ligase